MDKSSAELSNDIAEKEKELSAHLEHQQTIEQEILFKQREILELQRQKKDLEIECGKAKHISRKLGIEIKLLEKQFWASRNAGL